MSVADPYVLFLHGGPGFSAELERRRYGRRLPVDWWDQPPVQVDHPRPFEALVGAATVELERLSDSRGSRIAVLASSIGARIACALLDRVPDRVGAVTISGGLLDLRTAFVRLGYVLARNRSIPELEAVTKAAASSSTPETVWALFGRIVAVPGFMDCYWSPSASKQLAAMNALAAEGPLLDMETFQVVVNSLLDVAPAPVQSRPPRPVRVLLGRHDPYAEHNDVERWKNVISGATVELVEAGHFPHLELPAASWMPVAW